MSTLAVDAIVDSSNGNTATINGATPTAYNTMGKNRIINGAMEIDQRNSGASVTISASAEYVPDRFRNVASQASKFSTQQTTTAPPGFKNSTKYTSLSAYTVTNSDYFRIEQPVEGYNIADLAWGTSDAKTITISFWARANNTGTYGASVTDSGFSRGYPFTYSISSADTWTYITKTITGDTSGTWNTGNSVGLRLIFGLGIGSDRQGTANTWNAGSAQGSSGCFDLVSTNGANLYITGVQLEVGSVATEFERRPYGTELQLCQRYYATTYNTGAAVGSASNAGGIYRTLDATQAYASLHWSLPVTMRATPSFSFYSPVSGAVNNFYSNQSSADIGAIPASTWTGMNSVAAIDNGSSVNAQNFIVAHFSASAEL
jgi:hypothetical protein